MLQTEPRPVEVIKCQISAFQKGKELSSRFRSDDLVSKWADEAMLAHEEELINELHAAEMLESTNDVELSLTGMPVRDHSVTADFLGAVLGCLQELVKLVSFGIEHASSVGEKVSEKFLNQNKIMVTGWAASSFTVKLKLPDIEGVGTTFAIIRREKVLHCLEELFWDDTPNEELTNLVTKYAAKGTYKKLLGSIATQKATIQLRTKHKPYGVRLTSPTAKERIKWMDEPEEEIKELVLTGQLIGGNLESHHFFLKCGIITYSGKAFKEAQEQMKNFKFGDTVKALVEMTTKYRRRSQVNPVVSYKLKSIVSGDAEATN